MPAPSPGAVCSAVSCPCSAGEGGRGAGRGRCRAASGGRCHRSTADGGWMRDGPTGRLHRRVEGNCNISRPPSSRVATLPTLVDSLRGKRSLLHA